MNPTIVKSFKQDGRAYVDVSFTVGTDTVVRQFAVTSLDELKSRVRNEVEKLTKLASWEIGEGAVDTTQETTAPTAWETWNRDWGRLQRVQQLIDLQVLTGTEPPVVNLRSKVRVGLMAEYIDLL